MFATGDLQRKILSPVASLHALHAVNYRAFFNAIACNAPFSNGVTRQVANLIKFSTRLPMPLRVQYLDLCRVLNGMVNGYVIASGKFMR